MGSLTARLYWCQVARRADALRQRFHPESEFGGFTDIDGTVTFYIRVQELLGPRGVALDVGCGRGTQGDDPIRVRRHLRILKAPGRHVIGLDVDPKAADNPFIDEFRLLDEGGRWPVPAGAADLVIADFVLEHVACPSAFFAEAARVLREDGSLCVRTINAWSYLGITSRLVPNALHRRVLHRAQPERRSEDIFPTLYRCNSPRKMRRALARHGFDATVYGSEAEPSYLGFHPAAYRAGLLHRRFAPGPIKVGLVAWARKA